MLSNIEQAVATVVALKQDLIPANVLSAYVRVAGFTHWTSDAYIAFEHALDKYPDSAEKTDSKSAQFVAELRQSYWYQMSGVLKGGEAQPGSCPCCGITKLMQQMIEGHGHVHVEEAMNLVESPPGQSVFVFLSLYSYT